MANKKLFREFHLKKIESVVDNAKKQKDKYSGLKNQNTLFNTTLISRGSIGVGGEKGEGKVHVNVRIISLL